MTLLDVAERLHEFDDSQTIFAKRSPDWSAASEAVVCATPDDDSRPSEAEGLEYFLEVYLAKETVEVWSAWRDGKQPTIVEKLDAMNYYTEYDAWLPLDGQKPVDIDPDVAREQFIAEHGGLSKERCLWRGCSGQRIEGLAYCFEHCFSRPSSHDA